jgi:hypothetical protein
MENSKFNRATLQAADTTEKCGRVTAESVKRGFSAKKQSDLISICALAIFGSVVSLAPVSARAQGVPAEIAELKAQVAALQSQVKTLQTQLAAVQSNNALKLDKFVTVDPNPENGVKGPNIKFTGANIHILSGSGVTDDHLSTGGSLTGLGNLIIGYDELFPNQVAKRGGSHNLVIGRFHAFTSSAFGGLVAGENNTISAQGASASDGAGNTASGFVASVSGGGGNIASGNNASVSGGARNTASGLSASVSGGARNTASGVLASVSGGEANDAGGILASVSGGGANKASGDNASVSGGANNTAHGVAASVSGGQANTAIGILASVSGGRGNTASGFAASVIGGLNNTANTENSIRPQPPFP